MANQPESNEPQSDEREDSGLQDILAVAAKIKDAPDDEISDEAGSEREDSGLILFSAGDLGGSSSDEEDEGVFGSFAGGLGAGFETSADDPASSPDVVPLGGEGKVSETSPAEVRPKSADEPKRNPLTVLAVVLGLGLVAAGAVYLTNKDTQAPDQQAQAEMSANTEADAAVGKAEPTPEEPAPGASGGAVAEPEPEPEPEAIGETGAEGETEGAVLEDDGLLAAADSDGEDPMARKEGLLEGGSKPVAKSGKWDQGQPSKPASDPAPAPEPEPEPVAAPEPEPDPLPTEKPAGGGKEDDVKCLLEPDLPECNKGGASKPKEEVILAPKLPEKLDKTALRSGFNKVKSKAKSCGSKHGADPGTIVKIHASIEGATGKITSVSATGEHKGTDLGKCVEEAVQGATFEQFKSASQGVDYSMVM